MKSVLIAAAPFATGISLAQAADPAPLQAEMKPQ